MVDTKIPIRQIAVLIVAFLLTYSYKTFGQDKVTQKILERLYHIEDSIPPKSAHYMIITNKNCHACFGQLCDYYEKHNIYGDVYGIIVMNKNYLALLSTRAKYKNEIHCLRDVYFLFTENCVGNELENILKTPSPQLIMNMGDTMVYKSYSETMQLIK